MKKFILLFSLFVMSCFSVYAQSLKPSATTVNSGDVVTFTGDGETTFGGYFSDFGPIVKDPATSPVGVEASGGITYFNKSTLAPTTFKYKFTNTTSSAQTVFVKFTGTVNRAGTLVEYTGSIAITVNGTVASPTTFYNTAQSKVFYNTTCAVGYGSDPYTYIIPAHTYSSTVSQADANSKATAAINANGQNVANANSTCKILYYNDVQSASFTKNSCGAGSTGSVVTYTVPAHKYSSTISVQDANQKATNDISANGQNYANANGTCSAVIYARIEVTNIVSVHTNVPGQGGSHVHGFTDETTGNVYVKLYTDAACTLPFIMTTPTTISVLMSRTGTTINGDPNNFTNNLQYTVVAGTNTYSAGNQTLDFFSSDVNGPGQYQYKNTYDVVNSGNAYVPEISYYQYQ